jgi:hypothetical protein
MLSAQPAPIKGILGQASRPDTYSKLPTDDPYDQGLGRGASIANPKPFQAALPTPIIVPNTHSILKELYMATLLDNVDKKLSHLQLHLLLPISLKVTLFLCSALSRDEVLSFNLLNQHGT